jgi:hypothetical protein
MKKPRRAPFVVTVALAAAGSSVACGGSTSGDGSGGTSSGGSGGGVGGYSTGGYGAGGNPPHIPCPDALPQEGSACPQGSWWGNSCLFPDPCGGTEALVVECTQAGWHLLGSANCACPATQPTPGTACSVPSTEYCSYSDGCCPTSYSCQDGTWSASGVSCNPPYLECPATPPLPGEACNDCAFGLDNCSWNQACNGGPWQTFGSCVNGAWTISQSPCLYDGGNPYPVDGGPIIIDASPNPIIDSGNPPWLDGGLED